MPNERPVDPDHPDELFAVAPADFVAARNEVVKALKKAGERERAAQVAAWRRPTPVDWSLNVAARDDPELVTRFVDAAAAGRDAQAAAVEGRGGPDLRAAVGALRDATIALARTADAALAGAGAAVPRGTVSGRLGEIASQPGLAEQLARGCLGAGPVDAVDLFAGLTPGEGPARRAAKAKPVGKQRSTGAHEPRPEPAPEPPGPDPAELRRLRDAVRVAQRAAAAARNAVERASSRVERAAAALDAAATEQAELAAAAETAEAELEQAQAELEEAGG